MSPDIIRCHIADIAKHIDLDNESHWLRYYQDTLDVAWPEATCHLVDKKILVLEPDFLVDVSSLAECFKPYGSHPLQYLLARLSPAAQGLPLLLGNIVNLFLDEWIYGQAPNYEETMRKAFKMYPLQLSVNTKLREADIAKQFASDCRSHFNNVKDIVSNQLGGTTYTLDKTKAILEPSYLCPQLGLQGRLDYMQEDMHALIEMKSGRADEYSHRPNILAAQNHEVQMQLYQAILHYGQNVPYDLIRPYLLYTKYPLLYAAQGDMHLVHQALNLRNQIVAFLHQIAFAPTLHDVEQVIQHMNPEELNVYKRYDRFWTQYVLPGIQQVTEPLGSLSEIESKYYCALIQFITREMWLAKVGYQDKEGLSGSAALWLAGTDEKMEMGTILTNLIIENHKLHDSEHPEVTFALPQEDNRINFRVGDVVLFYRSDQPERAQAHRQQVIRGHVLSISLSHVCVGLRAPQHDHFLLDNQARFTIEPDSMDSGFHTMLRGLHAFTTADKERRELILGLREPRFDVDLQRNAEAQSDCFERMALKSLAAKDYFLLVGPPGTGKTSCALKRMVEMHYAVSNRQILLMAYTNRAVDEICSALEDITPSVPYTRIGHSVSCATPYQCRLLSKQIAEMSTRAEVHDFLVNRRVFVGTVAGMSNKPELFAMKHFDVAIIDEATQILEPQLLPLLCAKTADDRMAIERFVLIGDYKQLPAIVIQDDNESRVEEEDLNRIGISDLRLSLFERLYRQQASNAAVDMLYNHGRMHPDIADFPNKHFYNGKLIPVGLAHQQEVLQPVDSVPLKNDPWLPLLFRRTTFVPCEQEESWVKYNKAEAEAIGRLLKLLYQQQGSFAAHTVGVIASYRAQIALIHEVIESLALPDEDANNIMVDTVERYQGSQRDVILYSVSANTTSQMAMLSNLVEDSGQLVDRKLNVALTRARKQLFVFGVPSVLTSAPGYKELIQDEKYQVSWKNPC